MRGLFKTFLSVTTTWVITAVYLVINRNLILILQYLKITLFLVFCVRNRGNFFYHLAATSN